MIECLSSFYKNIFLKKHPTAEEYPLIPDFSSVQKMFLGIMKKHSIVSHCSESIYGLSVCYAGQGNLDKQGLVGARDKHIVIHGKFDKALFFLLDH